jgi:hypothetical protein
MPLKYVTGNLITSATLDSVSSEDASGFYNKENLYNKMQALPLRFTSKSGEYVIIDLGSDIAVSFAGVMNHNLTTDPPGTFNLKLWKAANGPIVTGAEGSEEIDTAFIVTAGHKNSFITFDETIRWAALMITDAGNSDNPEVGEFILGNHSTFTKMFSFPYREILRYIRGETITPYGQRWLNQKAKVKSFILDFMGITDANLLAEIEAFFEAIGGDDPFVFIPDDTAAFSWFMNCLSDLDADRIQDGCVGLQLNLVEQARGITLL